MTLVESQWRSKGYAKSRNDAPSLGSAQRSRTPPCGRASRAVGAADLRTAELAGSRAPGSQSRLPEPSPELCVCALWRHLSRHLLGFTCPELRRLLSFNCVVLFTKCFPPGGKHPTGPSSPRGSWGLPATSPAPRMWRGCRPSQASSLPPYLHQRGPAFVPSETILIPRTLP